MVTLRRGVLSPRALRPSPDFNNAKTVSSHLFDCLLLSVRPEAESVGVGELAVLSVRGQVG